MVVASGSGRRLRLLGPSFVLLLGGRSGLIGPLLLLLAALPPWLALFVLSLALSTFALGFLIPGDWDICTVLQRLGESEDGPGSLSCPAAVSVYLAIPCNCNLSLKRCNATKPEVVRCAKQGPHVTIVETLLWSSLKNYLITPNETCLCA